MDAIVRRKILGLVGLGIRGRLAVVGVQQVRDAARRGKLKLALVAGDASQNSLNKVTPLLTARGVTMIEGLTSADLAGVTGRDSVSAIGVLDAGLANGIRSAVAADG
ncbi:MAG TPA: ribosomal L7Ae/L30e/S12e/Gadd45 family protein [Gemmatimonadaceae bacterium]|nr:ribosomal L7Ae/L30e/S12e/Gadd45 family protein [Gemmatimonadaceae bacterium]